MPYLIYVAIISVLYWALYLRYDGYVLYLTFGVKFAILMPILGYFLTLLFCLTFNITPKENSIIYRGFHKVKNEKGARIVVALLIASLLYFLVSDMAQAFKASRALYAVSI